MKTGQDPRFRYRTEAGEDEIFRHYVKALKQAHDAVDQIAVDDALKTLKFLLQSHMLKVEKETVKEFFHVWFDLVTDTDHLLELGPPQEYAANFGELVTMVMMRKGIDDVIIPVERVNHWYRKTMREGKYGRPGAFSPAGCRSFWKLLSKLRFVFSVEDGRKVFGWFKDRIGSLDSNGVRAFVDGMMLLSLRVLPEVIDDLMVIVDNFVHHGLVNIVFCYFHEALMWYPIIGERMDWTKYVDRIFRAVMRGLRVETKIGGVSSKQLGSHQFESLEQLKSDHSEVDFAFLSEVILNCSDRGMAMECVARFLRIIEPAIASAKNSALVNALAKITMGLVPGARFWKWKVVRDSHPEKVIPVFDEAQRKRYAEILMPFARSIHYSLRNAQLKIPRILLTVGALSYDVARNEFMFALKYIDDPERGALAARALRAVYWLIPLIFNSEHLSENISLIPNLLEIVVPLAGVVGGPGKLACHIINGLYGIFYFDNSVENLKISMRMVAHAMIDRFDEIVRNAISEMSQSSQPRKSPSISPNFFAAFSADFIESKLDWIITELGKSDPKGTAWDLVSALVRGQPSLVGKLIEKVAPQCVAAPASAKMFWTRAFVPMLGPYPDVPKNVTFVVSVLEDLIQNKKFKGVMMIVYGLVHKGTIQAGNMETKCAPIDADITKMWGRLWLLKNVDPKLYQMSDDDAASILSSLMTVLKPVFDSFATCEQKHQVHLASCAAAMLLVCSRFDGLMDRRPVTEPFAQIRNAALDYLTTWNKQGTYVIKEAILSSTGTAKLPVMLLYQAPPPKRIFLFEGNDVKAYLQASNAYIVLCRKQEVLSQWPHELSFLSPIKEEIMKNVVLPTLSTGNPLLLRKIYPFCDWLPSSTIKDAIQTMQTPGKSLEEFFAALAVVGSQVNHITNEWLGQEVMAYVNAKFDKNWESVDQNLLSLCERYAMKTGGAILAKAMTPTFAQLQKDMLAAEKQSELMPLPFYKLFSFAVGGPAPISWDTFFWFWNKILADDTGRKRRLVIHTTELLHKMRPRQPKTVFDHYPEEQYMVDDTSVGFACETVHVKIPTGPAEFSSDSPYREVRERFLAAFDDETVQTLVTSLLSMVDKNCLANLPGRGLWRVLSVFVGPPIIERLEKVVKLECEKEYAAVQSEMMIGVFHASHTWSLEDSKRAAEKIVKPVLHELLQHTSHEIYELSSVVLAYLLGDNDWRRITWFLEEAKSLMSKDSEIQRLLGAQVIASFAEQAHPKSHELLIATVKEISSYYVPLSKGSNQDAMALAGILTGMLRQGYTTHYTASPYELIFEIIDAELKNADKTHLTVFLKSLKLSSCNPAQSAIPYVASRITQLVELRNDLTTQDIPNYNSFLRDIVRMPWYRYEHELSEVIDKLVALYKRSMWFIREAILLFVHRVCFVHMLELSTTIYDKIATSFYPLFTSDEKIELVEKSIPLIKMLIPVRYSDSAVFYQEIVDEKNSNLAAAKALALLGSVSILNGCPEWMPSLMQVCESLHSSAPQYQKLIETAFADFFKKLGNRLEIPELEEFRTTFGHGYFA